VPPYRAIDANWQLKGHVRLCAPFRLPPSTLRDLPLVAAAVQHSEVVASFGDGDIAVRKVIKNAPD
jgi:hypothetical protein